MMIDDTLSFIKERTDSRRCKLFTMSNQTWRFCYFFLRMSFPRIPLSLSINHSSFFHFSTILVCKTPQYYPQNKQNVYVRLQKNTRPIRDCRFHEYCPSSRARFVASNVQTFVFYWIQCACCLSTVEFSQKGKPNQTATTLTGTRKKNN